jgi:hypothetical protein
MQRNKLAESLGVLSAVGRIASAIPTGGASLAATAPDFWGAVNPDQYGSFGF